MYRGPPGHVLNSSQRKFVITTTDLALHYKASRRTSLPKREPPISGYSQYPLRGGAYQWTALHTNWYVPFIKSVVDILR